MYYSIIKFPKVNGFFCFFNLICSKLFCFSNGLESNLFRKDFMEHNLLLVYMYLCVYVTILYIFYCKYKYFEFSFQNQIIIKINRPRSQQLAKSHAVKHLKLLYRRQNQLKYEYLCLLCIPFMSLKHTP